MQEFSYGAFIPVYESPLEFLKELWPSYDNVHNHPQRDVNDTYVARQNEEYQHTKLDAALDAAKKGYLVFPVNFPIFSDNGVTCSCGNPSCESIGKHPILGGWLDSATTDEDQIREWRGEAPEANIGTPTGLLTGVVVGDEDTPEGSQWTSQQGYEEGSYGEDGEGHTEAFRPGPSPG